jgi:hypothetical protein
MVRHGMCCCTLCLIHTAFKFLSYDTFDHLYIIECILFYFFRYRPRLPHLYWRPLHGQVRDVGVKPPAGCHLPWWHYHCATAQSARMPTSACCTSPLALVQVMAITRSPAPYAYVSQHGHASEELSHTMSKNLLPKKERPGSSRSLWQWQFSSTSDRTSPLTCSWAAPDASSGSGRTGRSKGFGTSSCFGIDVL